MSLKDNITMEKHISELNGYLSAVSHLNDQQGYRHGFSADLIKTKSKSPTEAIGEYLKNESPKLEEMHIREEREIIEYYTFNNFLFNECNPSKKTLSFIREKIRWHIQEYFTIVEQSETELAKYKFTQEDHESKTTYIFTVYEEKIVIMIFHFRHEEIHT